MADYLVNYLVVTQYQHYLSHLKAVKYMDDQRNKVMQFYQNVFYS